MTVRVAVLAAMAVLACAGCGPEPAVPIPAPPRTPTARPTTPGPTVPPPPAKAGVFTAGTACRVPGSPGITANGAPLVCRAGPDGTLRWRSG